MRLQKGIDINDPNPLKINNPGTDGNLTTTNEQTLTEMRKTIDEAGKSLNGALKRLNLAINTISSKENEIEAITEKLNNFDKKVNDFDTKTDSLLDKIYENRDKTTETLAVFVALFTFISINFNFLSNRCLTPIIFIGLNIIIGGFLLIFTILVKIKEKPNRENSIEYYLLVLAIVLIVTGICLVNKNLVDYNICFRKPENDLKSKHYESEKQIIGDSISPKTTINEQKPLPSITPTK